MAKFRNYYSQRGNWLSQVNTFMRRQFIPLHILSPVSGAAHAIGWLSVYAESTSQGVASRKQGVKSPASYIIVGSIDDIWDDTK
jgi:hypothetical protein